MRPYILLLACLGSAICQRSPGSTTPAIECAPGPIDLVFVMDESTSVGAPNFLVALQAAIALTKSLTIGFSDGYSHVGFVGFSTNASVVFGLNQYYSNEDVANAIKGIPLTGGGTDIASGMKTAIQNVFSSGGRKDIAKVMVIITDGFDTSDVSTQKLAADDMGIVIYALGVGPEVDTDELLRAAGSADRIRSVADYASLEGVLNNICHEIVIIATTAPPTAPPYTHEPRKCPCKDDDDYVNVWLDIIFILDSSNGAGKDFTSVKELLTSMALYYPISQETGKFSRIAVINVAEEAQVLADLNKYRSGSDMRADINENLKQLGGDYYNPSRGLAAAQAMLDKDKEAGKRMNVNKVVVLFTTKDIDCVYDSKYGKRSRIQVKEGEDDPCRQAAHMVIDGVTLLTVALSIPGEEEPVVNIATPCFNTTNSQGMVGEIMRMLCMANCYCLAPYTQYTSPETSCAKYGECVYVDSIALSYGTAKETCKMMDATLSDILSRDKEVFLNNYHLDAGFFPYWIGMQYDSSRRKYVWDSTKGDASNDYSRWGTGQPNLATGECVFQKQYKFNTTWASEKCGRMTPTYYFSCQKKTCDTENYCDF